MCGSDLRAEPEHEAPPDSACRSFAVLASSIGLRANATAMLVISVTRSVCSAASASGRNGPCAASAVKMPSTPTASSCTGAVAGAFDAGAEVVVDFQN